MSQPLEPLFTIDAAEVPIRTYGSWTWVGWLTLDDLIIVPNSILWDPLESSDRVLALDENTIRLWKLGEGSTSATVGIPCIAREGMDESEFSSGRVPTPFKCPATRVK